ncbi:MAG: transcriptional regulator, AraC family [Caulobacter sp.]|nr:transcriptional regulator, AraC family [Caulobacter sp.]
MTGVSEIHLAKQHRSAHPGVEAISLVSDRSFPRHAHDHFGIGVMVFGGHRTWSPGGSVESGAGDVVAVNPGEMHDGVAIEGRARGWRMLQFDPELVAGEIGLEGGGGLEIVRPAVRDAALRARIEGLFSAVTAGAPDALALEEALLGALMMAFGRYGARAPVVARGSPGVGRALRRLDEAPEAAVSLSELAALSGMSRFALLRGFARETGTTPHAYLLQRRVRAARRALSAGRTPAQAAGEAGFADQSHMTRAFVRQLGVTPARYRAAVA